MSAYSQQHWYGAVSFLFVSIVLTFVTVGSDGKLPPTLSGGQGGATGMVAEKTWARRKTDEVQKPADYLVGQDHSSYLGYTIDRRFRKVLLEGDGESKGIWVDVAFIKLKNGKRLVKTFDADVYFGLGNSADYAYFPFLGDGQKQLFVSQDVFRGGRQWIARLTPSFKVLFDGDKLGVGREGHDLSVVDLDDDGTFEILVWVTDTYEFHDKMNVSQIPLPTIIFKYDPELESYRPANAQFKDYIYEDLEQVAAPDSTLNVDHRSTILNNLFIYIYSGEEKRAWKIFDQSYQLDDREEVRARVKKMLRNQPVYNLIYKHRKRK